MNLPHARALRALATVAALASTAPPLLAQSPVDRGGGLWWEVSASAAAPRLTCDICDPSRQIGPSLTASSGAYARPGLRVGLEGTAWTHEDRGVRESVYGLGLIGHLHPRPGSGLHVVGGAGWAGYRAEQFAVDGFRVTLGLGWDLPLFGPWVVGNRLTLDGMAYASLANDGVEVASPVGLSVIRFGVFLRQR